ncbi:MAG: Type 1 glutamine amidotransferase-like domain-containing protein [Alphaproteobacteria bacterium]
MLAKQYLNKIVNVRIDRPLGSKHPKHGFIYETNYGFIPNTISGDGKELDAYVLGINKPMDEFTGRCIAIIHRTDDDDDKLIVVPDSTKITDEEIESLTAYQEKWFKHIIIRNSFAIFLAGGGGYEDSAELDKIFFENIPENAKILYCPAAMSSDRYPSALEWFSGLVRRYHNTAIIDMLIEENVKSRNPDDYNAVFIGGGNTYKLLDFIIKNELDKKLKKYISNDGLIYGGSAGAIILGKNINTASAEDESGCYTNTDGLNLLNDACVACHWPKHEDYIRNFAIENKFKTYCIPENCGMIFDKTGDLVKTIGNGIEVLN